MFHLRLRSITFGGRSANLAYTMCTKVVVKSINQSINQSINIIIIIIIIDDKNSSNNNNNIASPWGLPVHESVLFTLRAELTWNICPTGYCLEI